MKNFRLFGEWLTLLGVTILLVYVAWQRDWVDRLDFALLDMVSEQRLDAPSEDIVVVEIDDRAVSQIGNWPWDRERHAELLNQLSQYEPDTVIVDVLFVDPSDAESDYSLAREVGAAGNIVLAHTFAQQTGGVDDLAPVWPIPELTAAARDVGHVAVRPDSDGIVRRFALDLVIAGESYPHLSLVALKGAQLNGGTSRTDLTDLPNEPIIPMLAPGAYRSISAVDVMRGQVPREFLQDKIVLIGATAQGLGDRYAVPDHAGRIMTGVEIQANVLSALSQGLVIDEASASWAGGVMFASIILLFIGFWQLPPQWGLRVSLVLIATLIGLSAVMIINGLWLPVFPAILGILLAYPLWGWRRLTAVSSFLEAEARILMARPGANEPQSQSGFDMVAQQVSLMRGLIGATRERLAFLRRTLSASPDPMMVFDGEGRAVLMNERAESLFGLKADWNGLTLNELLAAKKAHRDPVKQEIQTADGRIFLVASSGVELEEQGKIVSLRDITYMREAEQQRSEMLEFLSHDMRSPQAAIVGLVGLPAKGMPIEERLERIEQQARRTLKLTDDFVQIARLEYEGIEPEETDLSALLHEALDRAYPLATRKSISLDAEIPADPLFCEVDPYSFSRAIDNLVGNALKFSPEGRSITMALSRDAQNGIVITVSDEGPGLPPERVENTFARFGSRESDAGPSAGLGLAYVKKVVDEHDGEIAVRTKEGEGTAFEITLPEAREC